MGTVSNQQRLTMGSASLYSFLPLSLFTFQALCPSPPMSAAPTGGSAEVGANSPQIGLGGSTSGGGAGETSPSETDLVTTQVDGGLTSTQAEGGTTTTSDLVAINQAAQEAIETATEEKKVAEATVTAAQETATKATAVRVKIDDVLKARIKREAITGTTGVPIFTAPATSFQSLVEKMNSLIALETVVGLLTASNIGDVIIQVDPNTIGRSVNDITALKTVKAQVTAAIEITAKIIAVQQNVIEDSIEKINEAIAKINKVNTFLMSIGWTTTTTAKTTTTKTKTTIKTRTTTTITTFSTTTATLKTRTSLCFVFYDLIIC